MRRKVESPPKASPVDAHERTRDYLSEEEFALLLQGTPHSRYRWRNAAMLMLTFYHGLRVTELCRLRRQDVDLTHGRIWIQRLKGSLSTEQPLRADELRTLKRYVTQRGNAQLPWLFLNERGDQFTRSAINYNGTGVFGPVYSYGDNSLNGNGADGTFAATIGLR